MLAKDNVKYAILNHENKVSGFFTSKEIKEWNEDTINAVEVPKDREEEIAIGARFDTITNKFAETSLADYKQRFLDLILTSFEIEIKGLQGDLSEEEIRTWNDQLREAKEYKANPKATTPLLTQIAAQRSMDIKTLADKVISKNTEYLDKAGQLIGYRQNLEKQIEACKDIESLKKITYKSPFSNNNKG